MDIKEKMGKELRSYGANIVVLPGEGEYINQFNATHNSIIGSVPFLYFKSEVNTKKIEFAGADLDIFRELHSGGRTIVIVTHNPEIGGIGDKIIQISHGEVKY